MGNENKLTLLLMLVLLVMAGACNDSASYKEDKIAPPTPADMQQSPAYHANQTATADTAAAGTADNDQPSAQQAPAARVDWDKKIIKNAEITVEVNNYKTFNEAVHASAKQFGAYIAQEEQNESGYKIENSITIKVPVDQFDRAVQTFISGKEKIITQKITSQDVTREVIDTRARMEAKQQVRLRYLDLLKQAKNMAEILQVQKEIDDIQVEIEAAAGQVNYLTHAATFSTIQLTFYQVLNPQAEHPDRPAFGQRVLNGLTSGLEWMGEMLLIILTLWPLWLVAGGALWGVRKWKAAKPKAG